MQAQLILIVHAAPLALIWGMFVVLRRRAETVALSRREEARAAGLTQPASLHPVIDPAICIGCGACVNARPEGKILGIAHFRPCWPLCAGGTATWPGC